MYRNSIAVVLGVALGAGALSGCGDTTKAATTTATPTATTTAVILDTKRVERAIEDSIRSKRQIEADVECPTAVQQSKGLAFRCLATTSTGTATFVVQQTDGEGDVTYASP